jgi:hypothetical protein
MRHVCSLFVAAAIACSFTQFAGAQETVRVKIASNRIDAEGCHEASKTFVSAIPHPELLDRSFHGKLDGIEVVETAANHGHEIRNFAFTPQGNAITYELYAKGKGQWGDPPKVGGVRIGGGLCADAEGGSEGVDIYAHYKTSAAKSASRHGLSGGRRASRRAMHFKRASVTFHLHQQLAGRRLLEAGHLRVVVSD